MADQGNFAVNHNIGQKQYELSNHLGNVQATVSDMPFIKREPIPGTDILAPVKEPALVSAYDYYPFGMLQPGRYVSDTTSQCLTVSRNRWITSWISYCVPAWSPSYYTELGTATATLLSNNTLLNVNSISLNDGVSLTQQVSPGMVNTVSLDIASLSKTESGGAIVQVTEQIGSENVVLGSMAINSLGTHRINFTPTGSAVQLWILGPYDMILKPTCYTYPVTTQETYLVDICDENKDRYRFGFNGQEKDNELKGIGNSLDFKFRGLDPRVARFFAVDPLTKKYPWYTPYQFAGNMPINSIDVEGKEPQNAYNVLENAYNAAYSGVQKGTQFVVDAASQGLESTYHGLGYLTKIWEHGNNNPNRVSLGEVVTAPVVAPYEAVKAVYNDPYNGRNWGHMFVVLYGTKTLLKGGYNTISKYRNATTEVGELQMTQIGPIHIGGAVHEATGYANPMRLISHLEKRQKQGYKFETVSDMVDYGKDFFKREGQNIEEFTDSYGNIHRLDNATQEYGVLQPDNQIQTVFKIEPNERTQYTDGKSYMQQNIQKYGTQE